MVLDSTLLYQRFEKRKIYSPENIKIRFISRQNPQDFGDSKSPALSERGRGEQTSSSENFEFVSLNTAPELEPEQTFEIILPNLIHQLKKRNLKNPAGGGLEIKLHIKNNFNNKNI